MKIKWKKVTILFILIYLALISPIIVEFIHDCLIFKLNGGPQLAREIEDLGFKFGENAYPGSVNPFDVTLYQNNFFLRRLIN